MKKAFFFLPLLITLVFSSCGSSGGSSEPIATTYATYGSTVNEAIPAGLKTSALAANINAMAKDLAGTCAANYTDCPNLTAAGGGDTQTGEILMRLWGLDYNNECTAAYLEDGTCFECADCSGAGSNFIKPTMLANPSACATTATTQGRYVNFGIDPCFFDATIAKISNIEQCRTTQGGAVDVSSAVPWHASWGIPQTVDFSSYSSTSDGGIWWTVNEGASGTTQYFLLLDSNWLYAGIKDTDNDKFLFFGTGSPTYYAGRGEGNGVNIAAYAGPINQGLASFEAIQVRVQDPNTYIERLRSNGDHLWYQTWSGGNFPSTPAELDGVKNTPTDTRCVQIGATVETSKYVPLADCVTSFGAADEAALNSDDNYTLKIIDGETASSISFTSALTSNTTNSCLPAEGS